MALCSRNYSLCCSVLSCWGIIQLVIMGFLFQYKAVAFSEDLGIDEAMHEIPTQEKFYEVANERYETSVRFLNH